MLCVLFFCVNLWEIERTLSKRWDTCDSLGSSFSHRAHRVNRAFWRTVRAHRRPSAYRAHRALLLKVAVTFCEIGWLNVSVKLCVFCSSVLSVRKNMSFSLCHYVILSKTHTPVFFCHYVILSKKSHLSSFVIMSLCLKNHPCLLLSLCHYV